MRVKRYDTTPANDSARPTFFFSKPSFFDDLAAGVKTNLLSVLGIMIFTHLIFSITGNIAPVSFGWRIAQSIVCMSYYTYQLISPKHYHGD